MKSAGLLIGFFCSLLFAGSAFAQENLQKGEASFYADKFEGRYTASGEKYDPAKYTAAHLTLPFGTYVRVTNISNNRSVVVRINDRGPFVRGRIIDLSKVAAYDLGMIDKGVADVILEVVTEDEFKKNSEVTKTKKEQLAKLGSSPGFIPVATEQADIPEKDSVAKNSTENKEPKTVQADQSTPSGGVAEILYQVHVDKAEALGYGVQIASYRETSNMLRVVHQLRKKYEEPVIIQVATLPSGKLYRLVIGQFDKRRKAEQLRKTIRDEYPNCYIFDYSK
jgi:rare lipoprotein A